VKRIEPDELEMHDLDRPSVMDLKRERRRAIARKHYRRASAYQTARMARLLRAQRADREARA
jgi:hypothetical protein